MSTLDNIKKYGTGDQTVDQKTRKKSARDFIYEQNAGVTPKAYSQYYAAGDSAARIAAEMAPPAAPDTQAILDQVESDIPDGVWAKYSWGVNEALGGLWRGIGMTVDAAGSGLNYLGAKGRQTSRNIDPESDGGLWKYYSKVGDILGRAGEATQNQFKTKFSQAYDAAFQEDPLEAIQANPFGFFLKATEQVPMTLALMLPGLGVSGAVAGSTQLARFGALIGLTGKGATMFQYGVAGMAGAGVMRPIEGLMEAGQTYEEAKAKGFDEDAAVKAGGQVFADNMKLIGVDALQIMALGPAFKVLAGADSLWAKIGVEALEIVGAGLSEGAEEVYQSYVQKKALGEEFDLFGSESIQSFLLGMVGGVIFQAAGSVMEKAEADKAMAEAAKELADRLPPGFKEEVHRAVSEKINENSSPEEVTDAYLESLEKVAETSPEAIEGAAMQFDREMREAQQEANAPAAEETAVATDPFAETGDDIMSAIDAAVAEVEGTVQQSTGTIVDKLENLTPDQQAAAENLWENEYQDSYTAIQESINRMQEKAKTAKGQEKKNLQDAINKAAAKQGEIENEFIAKARDLVSREQQERAKNIVDETTNEVAAPTTIDPAEFAGDNLQAFRSVNPVLAKLAENAATEADFLAAVKKAKSASVKGIEEADLKEWYGRIDNLTNKEDNKENGDSNQKPNSDTGSTVQSGGNTQSSDGNRPSRSADDGADTQDSGSSARGGRGERSTSAGERPGVRLKIDQTLEGSVVNTKEPTGENEVPVKADMAKAYHRYYSDVLTALGENWEVDESYTTASGAISAKKMFNPAGPGVEGDANVIFWRKDSDQGIYLSGSGTYADLANTQIDMSPDDGGRGLLYRATTKDNKFTGGSNHYIDATKTKASEMAEVIERLVPKEAEQTASEQTFERTTAINQKQKGSALNKAVVTLFNNAGVSLEDESAYFEVKREGYMPLHVERLPGNKLALSYVFTQNGDLMRDPEVVFLITEQGQLVAQTIEHPPMHLMGRDLIGPLPIKPSDPFLKMWADNLKAHGFLTAQTEEATTKAEIKALEADLRTKYLSIGTTDEDGYTTAEQALAEVMVELELAEPGYRFPKGETGEWDGVPSTFPKWLPENARHHQDVKYLMETYDNVRTFTYPSKKNETKRRLMADGLFEHLDVVISTKLGTDFDTSALREKILKLYETEDTTGDIEKAETTLPNDAPGSEEEAQEPTATNDTELREQLKEMVKAVEDLHPELKGEVGFEIEKDGTSRLYRHNPETGYNETINPLTGEFISEEETTEEKTVEKLAQGEAVKATDLARSMGIEVVEVKLDDEPTASDVRDAEIVAAGGREKAGAEGRGLLDQYWTPPEAVDMTYSILKRLGVDLENAAVLEPSIGAGNFLLGLPKTATITGFEIDENIAKALKIKRPDINVINMPFERVFMDESGNKQKVNPVFDLVVGNPPYGKHRGKFKGLGEEPKISKYENYFIKRSLDVTKDGGYVALVVPSAFLRNSSTETGKSEIAKLGKLEAAMRLPNGAFENTDIGTDILVFKKDPIEDMKSQAGMTIHASRMTTMSDDMYFRANTNHVLGDEGTRTGRFGVEAYVDGSMAAAKELFDATNYANLPSLDNVLTETFKDIDGRTIDYATENAAELENKAIATVQELTDAELLQKTQQLDSLDPVIEQERRIQEDAIEVKKANQPAEKKPAKWRKAKEGMLDLRTLTDRNAYEEGQWAFVQPDGSLQGEFDTEKAYYMDGKYYNEFNYAQGNIYMKLEQLEADRETLGEEKYNKQKAILEAVIPPVVPVTDMHVSPHTRFAAKFMLDGKSLQERFLSWAKELPYSAWGESSYYDVMKYTRGEPVRGGDKLENEKNRRTRRIVGDEMFRKFLKDELTKEQQDRVAHAYNRSFNGYHKPDYTQVPLQARVSNSYDGKEFRLREVQKQGAGFLLNRGVGLLAHEVGYGKTIAGVVANIEMLQRGWADRPLIICPNENVYRQWISDIKSLQPDIVVNELANLGGAFKGDLATLKIPKGSISVITEVGFQKLRFKDDTYTRMTALINDVINDPDGKKTKRGKELEKAQTEELIGKAQRKTKTERYFEDLGFDAITYDEIHRANHIIGKAKAKEEAEDGAELTREFNRFGLTPSTRGLKTWIASQYIQEQKNGRNVIGLSATPFTNHPLEYYSILSLFATKEMREMGILNASDFMSMFMDVTSELEYKANGEFSEKQDIRSFKNMPEFQQLLNRYIDFRIEPDDTIVRPERQGREFVVPVNKLQVENKKNIEPLFQDTKNGGTLKAINELQLDTITPYAAEAYSGPIPEAKEFIDNSPKLKLTIDLITDTRKRVKDSNHIVYAPKAVDKFPTYQLMKEYMVKYKGFKPEEIEIITGATPKEKRPGIQDRFNKGEVRVILGSDAIQEGVNLQMKTTDMYIIGQPWNFTAVRQIMGRAWRPKNQWRNVRINQIFTENSIDVFMAQKLQTKSRRYEESLRSGARVIDVGDISYDELKQDLITDPVYRTKMEYSEKHKEIDLAISRLTSEFAYQNRKNEQYIKAWEEVTRSKQKYAEHPDWEWLERQIENAEKRLTELVANLKERGVDVTAIQSNMEKNEAELTKLNEQKANLEAEEQKALVAAEAEKETMLDATDDIDISNHLQARKEDDEDLFLNENPMFQAVYHGSGAMFQVNQRPLFELVEREEGDRLYVRNLAPGEEVKIVEKKTGKVRVGVVKELKEPKKSKQGVPIPAGFTAYLSEALLFGQRITDASFDIYAHTLTDKEAAAVAETLGEDVAAQEYMKEQMRLAGENPQYSMRRVTLRNDAGQYQGSKFMEEMTPEEQLKEKLKYQRKPGELTEDYYNVEDAVEKLTPVRKWIAQQTMRVASHSELTKKANDYAQRLGMETQVEYFDMVLDGGKNKPNFVTNKIAASEAHGVSYKKGIALTKDSTKTTLDHEIVHQALARLVTNKVGQFASLDVKELYTEAFNRLQKDTFAQELLKEKGYKIPTKLPKFAANQKSAVYVDTSTPEVVVLEEYIAESYERWVVAEQLRQHNKAKQTPLQRFFAALYDMFTAIGRVFTKKELTTMADLYNELKYGEVTGKARERKTMKLGGNDQFAKVRVQTTKGSQYLNFGKLKEKKDAEDTLGRRAVYSKLLYKAENGTEVVDEVRKDINLFENLLAQSRDIYLKDPTEFAAADRFEYVAELQDADKDRLDKYLAELIDPYMKLKEADRKRVDEILWEGDAIGKEFMDFEILGRLTDTQFAAFKGVRKALNYAHEMLLQEMRNKGIPEEEIEAFRRERDGYMPHKWKYPYVVKIKNTVIDLGGTKHEKTYTMSSYKTKAEADRVAQELANENEDPTIKFVVGKLASIEVDFFTSIETSMNRIASAIDQMKKDKYITNKVAEMLREGAMDMFKEKGFGRHYLRRTGVGGFDTTRNPEVLANYFTGFSGYISKLRHSNAYFNALSQVDAAQQPRFYEWLRDSIAYKLNNKPEDVRVSIPVWFPKKGQEAPKINISVRGLTFSYFLANDLSYLLTNATQNFVVGLGEMSKYMQGDRIIGPEKRLIKAMFDYSAGRISADEREIIDGLLARGQLGAEMSAELTGFKNNPVYREISSRFHRVLFKSTAVVEQNVNRVPAFLAMYRYFTQVDGMSREMAATKALEVSNDIHFRYGRQHRPRAFRGRLAVVFVFQHYIRSLLFQLHRDATRGEWVSLTRKLGYTTAIGGTLALPFAKLMIEIIRGIGGDDREEEEILRELDTWEIMLTRGIPAAALGVDMSSRVGIGLMSVDSIWENPADVRSYIGATGSLFFKRLPQGIEMIGQQRYTDAAGKLLPDVLANPIKAVTGYYWSVRTSSGNPLLDANGNPYKYNTWEALIRATGFTPTQESILWDQNVQNWKAEDYRSAARTDVRRTIQGMVQRGEIDAARDLQESALEEGLISENTDYVKEFNEANLFNEAVEKWEASNKAPATLQDIEDELIDGLYNGKVTDLQRNNVRKELAVYRQYGLENPYVDDIMKLRSNADKVQYLIELKEEIGEEAFAEFYATGRRKIKTEAGNFVPILFSDNLTEELRKAQQANEAATTQN